MRSVRWLAFLVLPAASLLVAGGTPAAASTGAVQPQVAVSCSGMLNPVNATSTRTERSIPLPDGRSVQLRSGYINGSQYAWSRVTPSSVAGDRIWIDISGTHGSGWSQCDLRTLGSTGRNYGNALRTVNDPNVCMRAGFRPYNIAASYITDWWC
jgi:hypothetical protein